MRIWNHRCTNLQHCCKSLGEEDKTPPEDKYDAECSVHPGSAWIGVELWRALACAPLLRPYNSSHPRIVSSKVRSPSKRFDGLPTLLDPSGVSSLTNQ